ncbi:hypothetical protein AGMMS50229_02000 [Campylobacterota bacterium]|nr:hypothetical protein AGMMS50229_02000 [Campylobacterota bacterium]
MSIKEQLNDLFVTPRGIDSLLLPTAVLIAIGFLIFAPKIVIANAIYLKSLQLERGRATLEVLQDENSRLRLITQETIYKIQIEEAKE